LFWASRRAGVHPRAAASAIQIVHCPSVEAEVSGEPHFDDQAFIAWHFDVQQVRASAAISVEGMARLRADLDRGALDVILLTTELDGSALIDARRD